MSEDANADVQGDKPINALAAGLPDTLAVTLNGELAAAPPNALVAVASGQPVETTAQKRERLARETQETVVDLLLERGLYSTVDTSTELGAMVNTALREGSDCTFDTFCVGCRDRSTFRIQTKGVTRRSIGGRFGEQVILPDLFAVQAVCQRKFHVYTYVFSGVGDTLTKIGQKPSLADLSFGELRGIDKSLEPVDRKELGTALGLFAQGPALGAFVYLRRVFERMVQRAHARQSTAGHAVEGFDAMRMDERIAALKDALPEKVVKNAPVFSVLSLGLHELTEEQCKQYFPVLKAVLFQMLEEEEHMRKAKLTAKETDAALQRILADLAEGRGDGDEAAVTEGP